MRYITNSDIARKIFFVRWGLNKNGNVSNDCEQKIPTITETFGQGGSKLCYI